MNQIPPFVFLNLFPHFNCCSDACQAYSAVHKKGAYQKSVSPLLSIWEHQPGAFFFLYIQTEGPAAENRITGAIFHSRIPHFGDQKTMVSILQGTNGTLNFGSLLLLNKQRQKIALGAILKSTKNPFFTPQISSKLVEKQQSNKRPKLDEV